MNNYKDFWKKTETKFVLTFTVVFLGSFVVLYALGLVPNEITGGTGVLDDLRLNAIQMTESKPVVDKIVGEEPVRLVIPNAGIDVIVQNPTSKDNIVLNEYLTRGTLRYVDSALLGAGNVLIFGHSSNRAVVQNQAFKALNGIEKLNAGDLIYVDSDTSRFTYVVEKVKLVNAEQEFIDFGSGKNMLTISTCNTFGQKQERYVAEAVFKSKTSL